MRADYQAVLLTPYKRLVFGFVAVFSYIESSTEVSYLGLRSRMIFAL